MISHIEAETPFALTAKFNDMLERYPEYQIISIVYDSDERKYILFHSF